MNNFREANQGKLEKLFETIVTLPESTEDGSMPEVDWAQLNVGLTYLIQTVSGENSSAFLQLIAKDASTEFMEELAAVIGVLGKHMETVQEGAHVAKQTNEKTKSNSRKESCILN
jgi:hypothetical protein